MPDDVRNHLIASTFDMVQVIRHGSVDADEANFDLWGAVYGSLVSSKEDIAQDATIVLSQMLIACSQWVDVHFGTESGDEMLAYVRERLQRTT